MDRDIYYIEQDKLRELFGIEGKFNEIVICNTTKGVYFFMNDETDH